MGCYNETCAISTLPINNDDQVRLIFLAKTPPGWSNKMYGTCDLWSPLSIPIRGRYDDDLGTIRGNVPFGLAERLLLKEVGRPETKGSLRGLIDEIRDALSIEEAVTYENRRIEMILVHESVYRAVARTRWVAEHTAIESSRTFRDDSRTYIELLRTRTEGVSGKDLFGVMLSFSDSIPYNSFRRAFSGEGGPFALAYLRHWIEEVVVDRHKVVSAPEFAKLVDELAILLAVNNSLWRMRRFWSPQTGTGSQWNDTTGHRVLGRAIESYIQKERREWRRHNRGPGPWTTKAFNEAVRKGSR